MRKEMIGVLKQHIMLANPMGIHDHTDLMEAIEKEVDKISEYMDKLEVMEKYFKE
jgi:hypothetical protein